MLLSKLKNNPSNPRTLSEVDFKKLLNKILVYPRLLEKNKITFDSEQDNTILGGNMRFKTLNHIIKEFANKDISKAIKQDQTALGVDNKDLLNGSVDIFSDIIDSKAIPESWTQDAKGLTAEEKEAFIIIDNVSDGKWDFDVLANEWDIDLGEWNVSSFDIDVNIDDIETSDEFSLKDGDREPFQQMTFTLSDEQAEYIKGRISDIKQTDGFKNMETLNENSNGNALYYLICNS